MLKRIIKIAGWMVAGLVLVIIVFALYIRYGTLADNPVAEAARTIPGAVTETSAGLRRLDHNWFRKSESGLYELYVEGTPFERGQAAGILTKELVRYQEEVFTRKLEQLVPSSLYRGFLKYSIQWFNRKLPETIGEEFRQEIYGVSLSASPDFDAIGPAYQRMLNYHAAHDIGHALQNISLVGCTSFATWKSASEDSSLIVGRNFDFTLGEEFSRDKIIAFYRPEKGHKFMMVTFGGMTGVLSGMNDAGLTVTLNAAKSEVPPASATPVSLVAREILQYASTIDEAYAIAGKRTMFVAESFLIGSAKDGRAALIEKTPEGIDLVTSATDRIISTNHFQGHPLGDTELNKEHMRTSASVYRYARVNELLLRDGKNSVVKSAAILRDRSGTHDQPIGLANEKSINQLVAHHSIIFQPEKLLVWVSTSPWQLGKYVCYDLQKVFDHPPETNREIYEPGFTIPEDRFVETSEYRDFLKFSPYRYPFSPQTGMQPDSLVRWNPESYQAWMLAGDYLFDHKEYARAVHFYETGLTFEAATMQERVHIEKNLATSKSRRP